VLEAVIIDEEVESIAGLVFLMILVLDQPFRDVGMLVMDEGKSVSG